MSNQEYVKDEISLWDYIDIIIKRKKIVLAIFFVSVIITAIVSLRMPKLYQATAYITIVSSKVQTVFLPVQTGEYLEQAPATSLPLAINKALLTSNPILERVINELKLTDESGKSLKVGDLSGKLDIKETEEASILQLATEDNNPKIAKEIVDAWAQEYIRYNQELISREIKGTENFVTDQLRIAKENLTQAEEKVKDFKDKYKIDLMRAELLNIKKKKLNNEKDELSNLESTLKEKDDYLRELKKVIEKQARFISDKRRLKRKQIDPVYQELKMRIVNAEIDINVLKRKFEYLKKSVELTEKEIDELEKNTNPREFELAQLTRRVEIYEKTYNSLSVKIEEARFAKAMQLGELKIISLATEPKRPIKPKKRQMVAISGVVSLMLGTFLAFFIEYWHSSLKKP